MKKPVIDFNVPNVGKYILKLAEKSDDIFWVQEVNGQDYLYVSSAFEELMGCSRDSLYKNNKLWLDFVFPDDKAAYLNFHEGLRQRPIPEKIYALDYRIQRDDQPVSYLHELVLPVFSQQSQLIGFVGIVKNMTIERGRLSELERSTQYFQLFAEKMKAVFWVREYATNKQLYLSPGYEGVWGRSRELLYSDPDSWFETIHPEDRDKLLDLVRLRELCEKQDSTIYHETRYRIIMPDKSIRHIKDTCFPIKDEYGNFVVFAGVAENVTKEVEYEQALREEKERAEAANKAKSDFLAMISHELRTPLNAILGMSQIIKTKNVSEEIRSCVDAIADAGSNLLSLVSDVLDFARLEVGKLKFLSQPFNLPELFQRSISSMEYLALEKGLKLNFSIEKSNGSAYVVGDPNRVRQVLANLLTNAIKFTNEGRVSVTLKSERIDVGNVCFEVVVKDTGIGIPADKLENIFEKFSQVDSIYQRKHSGIGLGLSITKELIEVMGGEISVSSEVGKGTSFHFTMCFRQQTDKELEDVALRDALIYGSQRPQFNLKLLMVEDNHVNQRVARMMFEDFGCHVDILNNAEEVMARLDSLPNYDLIFMDVGLPDVSGFEITARLRQEDALKDMPIIAMTAYVLEGEREQAFAVGMNKVIVKPISYEEIRLVLEEYKNKLAAMKN
jgi:PAS domain S-box-containing protein